MSRRAVPESAFCSFLYTRVSAPGGDEASVADREANFDKPFIYTRGKAMNLFQETRFDSESNSVFCSHGRPCLSRRKRSHCLILSVALSQPVEFH